MREYQERFSEEHPSMFDVAGRERKAATLVAVLQHALGTRLGVARCLNVGCSTGILDSFIAPYVGSVLGIDIDEAAVAYANAQWGGEKLRFQVGDAMALDVADASYDVVICAQVYEHVPDPAVLMLEIERVLVPGGVCYFAATNLLCVVEQHYFLPFLSMLPKSLADRYIWAFGKGEHYYERHLSYWGLRRLAWKFLIDDYTRKIVNEPLQFHTGYMVGGNVKAFILRWWLRLAFWSFPGYIWLLRKGDLNPRADAHRLTSDAMPGG